MRRREKKRLNKLKRKVIKICWKHFPRRSYAHPRIHHILCASGEIMPGAISIARFSNSPRARSERRGEEERGEMPTKIGSLVRRLLQTR